MVRKIIKQIPFFYNTALHFKHLSWSVATLKEFKKYWASADVAKLQLGCGTNVVSGWFNTDYFLRKDVFFLNVVKKFPFPDNTFHFVFSEHHIEHITYKQAHFMLGEVFRTMKPGGYIKLVTPDLEKYIGAYANDAMKMPEIKKQADDWIYSGFGEAAQYIPVNEYYNAHFVNDIFHNYSHFFIYDELSLKSILENAGFKNCTKLDFNNPGHSVFQNIDSHTTDFDHKFSLYMIAQKPL